MDGAGRHDEGEAAGAEFAGIAHDDDATRRFGHNPIDAGFEHVGRGEAIADVETVYRKEEEVGVEFLQRFFGERTDERKRIFAEDAAGEDDFDGTVGEFGGDVGGVGDDGETLEVTAGAGDRGRCGAGIEDDDLALADHANGGFGDAQFFFAVHLLLFFERAIAEGAGFYRERAAVSAFEKALVVEGFEVFANGDL